jgi:hypothetical protein
MKKSIFCPILFYIAGGLMSVAHADLTLHYLPFATGTFTPVTPENIEQKAKHKVALKDDSEQAKTLQTLFDHAGVGKFDAKRVRLKVSGLGGEVYFVDQIGNIRYPQDQEGGFSEANFARIKALVESLL